MDHWFASISASTKPSWETARALETDGFMVMPGIKSSERLAALSCSYDHAVAGAVPEDIRIGSATTRVRDFVNRGVEFDDLYLFPPILEACCRVIKQPFKLSTMHARTLRPRMPKQPLHADFPGDLQGWPMVGFIVMIDDFTPENGATCFIPGSQGMKMQPDSATPVPACGLAGSVIVFNGSVWHGHGANLTDAPRRSIQGAYIRRTETSGDALAERMRPETRDRIGALAKYLLTI